MRELELGGLRVRVTGGTDRQGGGEGPVVVLLHGFGAPGDDLVPLYRVLPVPGNVRFVFPEAPIELLEYGPGARAWWRLDTAAMEQAIASGKPRDLSGGVPPGMPEARAMLVAMLEAVRDDLEGFDGRMILGGFSQGAMLSCDVALHTELPLKGLVQLSGTLVARDTWEPLMGKREGLPILQSHGREDPLLPFGAAEGLRELWEEAGGDVTWVPFHGGHEIPYNVLDHLGEFIRTHLPSEGGA